MRLLRLSGILQCVSGVGAMRIFQALIIRSCCCLILFSPFITDKLKVL